MFIVSKEFEFCASHQLEGLCEGHPCMRHHGHNYKVIVEMKSETLNDNGFVMDYREMQPIKDFIDGALDHKHLNDFWDFQPSAENIAKKLYEIFKPRFPLISAITVKETDKTAARYEPTINPIL
jgi:6-pyruvoyltetrahydropterin/6-carboxytetrahydropterin synthase